VQKEALQAEVARQAEQVRALKAELASLRGAQVARQKELQLQLDKVRAEADEQQRELANETARLKKELAAKPKGEPKPPREPREPTPEKLAVRKIPRSLGNLDLDEGPDALPISIQLGNALRKNAGKVLDLFRDWDTDGDGEVSRKEFHEAMAALGLEVPKEHIDRLFNEWDSDGGGSLEFAELKKILSRPAAVPAPMAQANTVVAAAAKLKGFGTKAKAVPA